MTDEGNNLPRHMYLYHVKDYFSAFEDHSTTDIVQKTNRHRMRVCIAIDGSNISEGAFKCELDYFRLNLRLYESMKIIMRMFINQPMNCFSVTCQKK